LDIEAKNIEWRRDVQDYLDKHQFKKSPRPKVESSRAEDHVPGESAPGEHPTVQAAKEYLCLPTNTVDGVCRADHGSVVFDRDTIYERPDLKEIILNDTTISCKQPDGFPCHIAFRFNKTRQTTFTLSEGSSITASQLIFDSPTTVLTVDATSSLSTSGRAFSPKGSATGQGASYIGQGGGCATD
jgi:hypothetical protein